MENVKLIMCISAIAIACFSSLSIASESATWKIKTFTDKHPVIKTKEVKYISIDNGTIYADFSDVSAWALRKIKYNNEIVVQGRHGAWNGTVSNIPKNIEVGGDKGWCGTGHGGDIINKVEIIVDGKAHPIADDITLEGKEIKFVKHSRQIALNHIMEITFPASGDYIIEKHSFEAIEPLKDKFNFMYGFMHCNNNSMKSWLALLDEKGNKTEAGICTKDDMTVSLKKDIKALTFYSQEMEKGIVYIFPEVYEGSDTFKNSIYDRPHDNKFYFRPLIKKNEIKTGDKFEYQIKVIPFESSAEKWKETSNEMFEKYDYKQAESVEEKPAE
jgi:hypothetical protein